jgi:hypothetical protein
VIEFKVNVVSLEDLQDAVNQAANYGSILHADECYVVNFTNKYPSSWIATMNSQLYEPGDDEGDVEILYLEVEQEVPPREVKIITVVYSEDWVSLVNKGRSPTKVGSWFLTNSASI